MKKYYKTPVIEITTFYIEDIITSSGLPSDTPTVAQSLPEADIPPVLDASDVFYN